MTTKLAFFFAVPMIVVACGSSDDSSSSTSSTSSSGSPGAHTCADLMACCAKIMTTDGTQETCNNVYQQYKANDTDCSARYPAFAPYCP